MISDDVVCHVVCHKSPELASVSRCAQPLLDVGWVARLIACTIGDSAFYHDSPRSKLQ